jgi:predicted TIM-barrel fold metal-dependent hydrolase
LTLFGDVLPKEAAVSALDFPVFDGDGHIFEDDDELLTHFEAPHKYTKRNKSLPFFPTIDGWARGAIHEREDNTPGRYSHTDAKVWSGMLDKIGCQGSVLYPTAGLAYGLMQDGDFAIGLATAYNNWLEERYTKKDDRLYGAGLMPIENPDAAIKEMRRCATQRKNFVAMYMPTVTVSWRKYGNEYFWPIYEEAERLDMPIAFHGGPSAGLGLDHMRPFLKTHTMSHPYPLFLQLTDLVFSGVFDAFPKLQIALLEAGCSWVPFMIDRLDYEYHSIFGNAVRGKIKRNPGEYLRDTDNIWMSCELGERGMRYTVDAIGSERIMYASDFPHEPTEEDILSAVPKFLSDNAYDAVTKENVLGKAAKRFYRIDAAGKVARTPQTGAGTAGRAVRLEREIAALQKQLAQARAENV